MILAIYHYYHRSLEGFSREVWILTIVTLINRAGAMVIPFLSIYFATVEGFDLGQIGWLMTSYGFGSFAGAWFGGRLSDRIGYYKTMVISLLSSGVVLLVLSQVHGYNALLLGVFIFTFTNDLFRPASYVALNAYSRPQNRTRAISLVRLAINLGFSIGPAVGGLLIAFYGYAPLFYVDGGTCLIAGLIVLLLLSPKQVKPRSTTDQVEEEYQPDYRYWLFLVALFAFSFLFIQYFSVLPVFYKTVRHLAEDEVGYLMAMNGILIFLFEMPLIYALENSKSIFKIMAVASALLGVSFLILNFSALGVILVIGMAIGTLAEMLCFPFANAFALKVGKSNEKGKYMAIFQMSFSLAHVIGHNAGMHLTEAIGYDGVFYTFTLLALISGGIFLWLHGMFSNL